LLQLKSTQKYIIGTIPTISYLYLRKFNELIYSHFGVTCSDVGVVFQTANESKLTLKKNNRIS